MNENEPLLRRTLRLIDRVDISPVDLCKNVRVSVRWYYKLLSGEIKDPSVNKIQRIHDYLERHASVGQDRIDQKEEAA